MKSYLTVSALALACVTPALAQDQNDTTTTTSTKAVSAATSTKADFVNIDGKHMGTAAASSMGSRRVRPHLTTDKR